MATKQATASNSTIKASNRSRRGGRIPVALQAIFLASNGGQEVNEPPRNLGFKVFSRILGRKSKKQVYDSPEKKDQMSSPENDEVSQTLSMSFLQLQLIHVSIQRIFVAHTIHDPFLFCSRMQLQYYLHRNS
jgi:hypothetical protein